MGNKLDGISFRQCQPQQQQRPHRQSLQLHNYYQQPNEQQYFSRNNDYKNEQPKQHQYHHQQQQQQQPEQTKKIFRRKKGKLSSCPDLLKEDDLNSNVASGGRWSKYNDTWGGGGWAGGLKEYKTESNDPDKEIDIKIYRSYTDIHADSYNKNNDPPLKITVYRRSQESLNNFGRVQSVPRLINKTDYSGSTDLSNSIESRLSIATQETTRPPSRRSQSRCSSASAVGGPKTMALNVDEFPTNELVKKKQTTFREFLSSFLTKNLNQMSLTDQMSFICIAIMPDRANQSISLMSYLDNRDKSLEFPNDVHLARSPDFNSPCNLYPTLPFILTEDIKRLKNNLTNQSHDYTSMCLELCAKIVAYLVRNTAEELARIYEYQISLVQETIALRLLAKYVSSSIIETLKWKNKLLEINSMVAAGVFLLGKKSGGPNEYAAPKWVSIICFSKEYKWNLYDIFKKCALRKDIINESQIKSSNYNPSPTSSFQSSPQCRPRSRSSLTSSSGNNLCSERRSTGSESILPWKFYASQDSEPMLYGYRGQSIEYDFVRRCYKLSNMEESTYSEELPWRYDDFHRVYSPYYRLISDVHLVEYCEWIKTFKEILSPPYPGAYFENRSTLGHGDPRVKISSESFKEYLRQIKSGSHVREDIFIVYRDVMGQENINCNDELKSDLRLIKSMLQNPYNSTLKPNASSHIEPQYETTPKEVVNFQNYAANVANQTSLTTQRDFVAKSQFQQSEQNFQPPLQQSQQPNQYYLQQQQQQPALPQQQQHQLYDESLSRVLAQVTLGCDELCNNLKNIDRNKNL